MAFTARTMWRSSRVRLGGALAIAVCGVLASLPATAQIVPTPNPGRDCQTIRTCNFSRSGAVRGCLSSYSCRICRLVRARCSVGNRREVCERMVCSWGA